MFDKTLNSAMDVTWHYTGRVFGDFLLVDVNYGNAETKRWVFGKYKDVVFDLRDRHSKLSIASVEPAGQRKGVLEMVKSKFLAPARAGLWFWGLVPMRDILDEKPPITVDEIIKTNDRIRVSFRSLPLEGGSAKCKAWLDSANHFRITRFEVAAEYNVDGKNYCSNILGNCFYDNPSLVGCTTSYSIVDLGDGTGAPTKETMAIKALDHPPVDENGFRLSAFGFPDAPLHSRQYDTGSYSKWITGIAVLVLFACLAIRIKRTASML
jgi:hypothetical protein